jgi:quinol monooxygenase YgiN
MIYVIATLDVKPGKSEQVIRAAGPLIAATRLEQGCLSYDLSADVGNANNLVFVERWEHRDDLEAHFDTGHMAAFSDAVKGLLESERVEIIEPTDVEVL